MISYIKCSDDVDIQKVYNAFRIGFSDYIIKAEISEEDFVKRFFGPEGNQVENSFIALDGHEPVGLILGGIKDYEGIKTIRCGALCVHPDYRGKGVSKELFRLHKQSAIEEGCRQMFLEVIVGNDRAIKFYSNLGYDKIYDLSYFSCDDTNRFKGEKDSNLDIKEIGLNMIFEMRNRIRDIHINWQNDIDYMEKLEGLKHYGFYKDSQSIGALSISPNGKIYFIYIEPEYRNIGIGKALINNAVSDLNLSKLSISFPNNSNIEGFLKHMNFSRDKIFQYEMYLAL